MSEKKGVVYILTNPSFPEYVKIGYADDVIERVNQLNRNECTPFAFRVYATYEVNTRLTDIKIHNIIDKLIPNLRSIDAVEGKKHIREFYTMSPEDAYEILEAIAEINSLQDNLKLWEQTSKEQNEEAQAEEIKKLVSNRHHFQDIEFTSSTTGKSYRGTTGSDGTLCIIENETNSEVENFSRPSKQEIVGQAILDLGGDTDKYETLYQRYRKLTKLIKNSNERTVINRN